MSEEESSLPNVKKSKSFNKLKKDLDTQIRQNQMFNKLRDEKTLKSEIEMVKNDTLMAMRIDAAKRVKLKTLIFNRITRNVCNRWLETT